MKLLLQQIIFQLDDLYFVTCGLLPHLLLKLLQTHPKLALK
jgi:hypothetical protein